MENNFPKLKGLQGLFFRPAVLKIFVQVKDGDYSSKIAKASDVTYPHAQRIMMQFAALGLMTKVYKGRECNFTLTEKGHALQRIIKEAVVIMESDDTIQRNP